MSKAMNIALFSLVAFVVVAQSQPLSNELMVPNHTPDVLYGGESSAVGVPNGNEPKNYIREKRTLVICNDFIQALLALPPCGSENGKLIIMGNSNQVGVTNNYGVTNKPWQQN